MLISEEKTKIIPKTEWWKVLKSEGKCVNFTMICFIVFVALSIISMSFLMLSVGIYQTIDCNKATDYRWTSCNTTSYRLYQVNPTEIDGYISYSIVGS